MAMFPKGVTEFLVANPVFPGKHCLFFLGTNQMFSPKERWCDQWKHAIWQELWDIILHGSVRTTAAVRRAIQHSQESLKKLAQRYIINPKTVAKWRKRTSVEDAPMGPEPRSTTLTVEEEAIPVAFRKHTLLPLDDCLYALQPTIPKLTRSAASSVMESLEKFKRR